MPIYAECGGLMYLSQGIADVQGERYPMVGVVPGWCSMEKSHLHLGYVEVSSFHATPLGPSGFQARGHECHWSIWGGPEPSSAAYSITNRSGRIEGYARGNVLASFVHLHFGTNPSLAPTFVENASGYRNRKP